MSPPSYGDDLLRTQFSAESDARLSVISARDPALEAEIVPLVDSDIDLELDRDVADLDMGIDTDLGVIPHRNH